MLGGRSGRCSESPLKKGTANHEVALRETLARLVSSNPKFREQMREN